MRSKKRKLKQAKRGKGEEMGGKKQAIKGRNWRSSNVDRNELKEKSKKEKKNKGEKREVKEKRNFINILNARRHERKRWRLFCLVGGEGMISLRTDNLHKGTPPTRWNDQSNWMHVVLPTSWGGWNRCVGSRGTSWILLMNDRFIHSRQCHASMNLKLTAVSRRESY